MKKLVDHFRMFTETRAFGVCAWLGEKLGIRTANVRLSFIYLSFVTFGSPLLIYMIIAFHLENKRFFKPGPRRPNVWDL